MNPRRDREQFLTIRTAYIWSALVGVIGVILVVTLDPNSGTVQRVISVLGQALLSAALVAITFGWISSEENELRIQRILKKNLRSSLQPVFSRTFANSLTNRSWRCHLESPMPGDTLPDYLYQTLAISYSTSTCPRELRFVGIAEKEPDWSAYYGDEYQFRWGFDEGLDIEDSNVFKIDYVRLDGRNIQRIKSIRSKNRIEYRYRLPKDKRGYNADVSFVVHVRKFIGSNVRLLVPTKVFSDVTGATFLLSVGASVGATAISSSCDGVTTLIGEPVRFDVDNVADPSGRPISRNVRLFGPIQPDSQVSFEIDRSVQQPKSG